MRADPAAAEPAPAVAPAPTVRIEDPSGRALAAFHEALRRARARKAQVRLLFFGASHTASDIYTGVIRRELQRRFGDAGHGFVMPARPWTQYRHEDIGVESTNTWHTDRVGKPDDRADGWYGLAGMSVSSASRKDYGRIRTVKNGPVGRRVGRFELFYLKQPSGGTLAIRVDGRRVRRVRTASDRFELGYETIRVRDRGHTFEVRPEGDGEVRLFGVVLERSVPGVVVDTLGIPGARARDILAWNPDVWREHLQRRKPDLVVLAYGTNESGDDEVPIAQYEAELREVLRRLRAAVPEASCLLIGPSDRPIRFADGTLAPRPRTEQIAEVQRRVASESGCGFFDLVAFTGGPMSLVEWAQADPPLAQPDLVHFTRAGYERLGRALLTALLRGCACGESPEKRHRRYIRQGFHRARVRGRGRDRVRARPGPGSGVRSPESGVRLL